MPQFYMIFVQKIFSPFFFWVCFQSPTLYAPSVRPIKKRAV